MRWITAHYFHATNLDPTKETEERERERERGGGKKSEEKATQTVRSRIFIRLFISRSI
jgi:hypothetical protein